MSTRPLSEADKQAAVAAYQQHGSESAAAEALGISRGALSNRLRQARARDIAPVPCAPWVASKKYIITAAVNATPVHAGFWATLKRYAKHTGARIVCVPLRYKNPTSTFTAEQSDDDWWAAEVVPYLYSERRPLHKHLMLMADVRTQPTAVNPLGGMDALTKGESSIIAHPKIALTTVPVPRGETPKLITTTGACTMNNYSPTVAGAKGDFHHSFGALVVELADNLFHVRHVNAVADGSFIDLTHEYRPEGVRKAPRAAALVLGDLHVDFVDPSCDEATFGPGGMVETLKPEAIVLHDVLDCYSVSHHHERDPVLKFAKHHSGRHNVLDEVRRCFDYIDSRVPDNARCVLVGSNHNDHLGRWVRDTDPRRDPENALAWAGLYTAMCATAKIGDSGLETIDPLEYLARTALRSYDRTSFIGRSGMTLAGVEIGFHGDRGPNGARGSRKAFSKIGVRTVIGHSHSPGIEGGCYQTGTSSRLVLEYSAGSPSGWMHTHCVVYANGKRALLHAIKGKWHGR